MKSSNPVLGRLAGRANRHAGLRREPVSYGAPGYAGAPYGAPYGDPYGAGYDGASDDTYAPYAPSSEGRMTVDDVAVRTAGLLAIVGIVGALAWNFVQVGSGAGKLLLIGAGLGALIMSLVISFKQITNPYVISAFAVLEGALVGVVSKLYGDAFGGGIVLQAAVGTFAVFFGMAAIYKMRIIRATPKFARWIIGLMFGALVLLLANFVLAAFGVNDGAGLGLRDGSPLSIALSFGLIALAALSFILDFAAVEHGVEAGLPRRYSWYCAFGILVGLVWLYFEILRLLSYFRD